MSKVEQALRNAVELLETEMLDMARDQEDEYKDRYSEQYKPHRIEYAKELVFKTIDAINQCKAALAELEKCEPVGYLCESPDKVARIFVDKPLAIHSHTNTPLYTSPQPRDCEDWQWLGMQCN